MDAIRHSRLGVAATVLAVCTGAVFLSLIPSLHRYIEAEATESIEAPGTGLTFLFVIALLVLVDLIALGLGFAGLARRRRRKAFAAFGIIVGVLVLMLVYTQGFAWEAA